ncbi:uncharacterized protein LOC120073517 [Benincasa hispida]|uniref:uncharacterized protein LOC120073517 n=1 Tax=Benincasa hispida TaxID=102211 RepID=UPI0019020793|nr:uncharacterized protein LOC120073517 [Benincasa hispida]
MVNDFFSSSIINASLNETYICLIPKNILFKDYFNLISCAYKIIIGVLSNQLKPVLSHTIAANQLAFMVNRQILDASLMTNKLIDDQFSTNKAGFGVVWHWWIRRYVASANYSIILKGHPRGKIILSHGIQQGDALSLFLFILVANCLSRLLEHNSSRGHIISHPIGTSFLTLHHLQFADDTLLFSTSDHSTLQNLFDVVGIFESAIGLNINLSKSELLGIHLVESNCQWMLNTFGCNRSSWSSSYLGFPLVRNSKFMAFRQLVVEKIKCKLNN